MSELISVSEATITRERVDLISVSGCLDDAGLMRLRSELGQVCAAGAGLIVADLSRVYECDRRLFHLLARTHRVLTAGGGWLRLAGMGAAVLTALEGAPLPEVLVMYRASEWGGPAAPRPDLQPVIVSGFTRTVAPTPRALPDPRGGLTTTLESGPDTPALGRVVAGVPARAARSRGAAQTPGPTRRAERSGPIPVGPMAVTGWARRGPDRAGAGHGPGRGSGLVGTWTTCGGFFPGPGRTIGNGAGMGACAGMDSGVFYPPELERGRAPRRADRRGQKSLSALPGPRRVPPPRSHGG